LDFLYGPARFELTFGGSNNSCRWPTGTRWVQPYIPSQSLTTPPYVVLLKREFFLFNNN